MIAPTIQDGQAVIRFSRFDLEGYPLFLKAKALPEVRASYDHEHDTYELRAPARFMDRLNGMYAPARITENDLSAFLFDYQKHIIREALEAKHYGMWADCGMGKTPMGLEYALHVESATGSCLVSAPKNVLREWRQQADRFYGRTLDELKTGGDFLAWTEAPKGIALVTHHKFAAGVVPGLRKIGGMVLDESSILKTGGGQIKWNIIHSAKGIEYKAGLTATPAPNDVMEYASQAAFLEKIRDGSETLWTYFSKKGDKGEWEIKPHAKGAFYRYLASWSIYLRNPARFGFKDNVKELPPVKYFPHALAATPEQHAFANTISTELGGGLFTDQKMGIVPRGKLAQAAKGFLYDQAGKPEPIHSLKPAFVASLADDEARSGRQVIIWTAYNSEADFIARHLKIEHRILDGRIKSDEERDEIQDAFERGDFPILITNAMLAFGGNKQFVDAMVVSGVTDSFEQFYQLVRRGHRYGRTRSLRVHIPYIPELEGLQWANVQAKAERFESDASAMEAAYAANMLRRAA